MPSVASQPPLEPDRAPGTAAARAARAALLADEQLAGLAQRLEILSAALRRRWRPAGQTGQQPFGLGHPLQAIVEKVAARCRQDSSLAMRIEEVLDRWARARRAQAAILAGPEGDLRAETLTPEALRPLVESLLSLHEVFAGDPVLGRLFPPPRLQREAADPPGHRELPGPAAGDPGPASSARHGGGFDLGPFTFQPEPSPWSEVDRASRAVALAQDVLGAIRERVSLLDAALRIAAQPKLAAPCQPSGAAGDAAARSTRAAPDSGVASGGDHTAARAGDEPGPAPLSAPARDLVGRLSALATDPDLTGRISQVVAQFRMVEEATSAAEILVERARHLGPGKSGEALAGFSPERLRLLVEPLTTLHLRFRDQPLLARFFPALT